MKVVHLGKNDKKAVPRALAHQGLRRIGQESFILVVSRTSDDSAVTTVERPMDLGGRLRAASDSTALRKSSVAIGHLTWRFDGAPGGSDEVSGCGYRYFTYPGLPLGASASLK